MWFLAKEDIICYGCTMNANAVEIFGTVASLVIAISLMMRNVKWLRWVNLGGSLLFALYGLMIKSLPVFLVNCFCVLIDAWQLRAMRHSADVFSLLKVKVEESEYLRNFLAFHSKDIRKYSPEFDSERLKDAEAEFVLRDAVPAAVVVYRKRGEGEFDVLLDYATPAYRDYRNAEYFFSTASHAIAGGKEARLYERASDSAQIDYLRRLGFAESDSLGVPDSVSAAGTAAAKDSNSAIKEFVKTIRP